VADPRSDTGEDPLADLRAQLRATTEAAQRLVSDVPPSGWAVPDERVAAADEARALMVLLHALRDAVAPELWEEIREVLRRLLLVIRALLDVAVQRLESEAANPPASSPVRPDSAGGRDGLQDIPVR
jgi:hypothetical protein